MHNKSFPYRDVQKYFPGPMRIATDDLESKIIEDLFKRVDDLKINDGGKEKIKNKINDGMIEVRKVYFNSMDRDGMQILFSMLK